MRLPGDGRIASPPSRAVAIWSRWRDFPKTWVSYDEFEPYQAARSFDAVALVTDGTATVGSDEPERVVSASVTGDAFRILGVEPALGRAFLPEELRPGGPRVVLLGHELWERRFAGDPSVVGRKVEIDGAPQTVVGVLPAGFRMLRDFKAERPTELWRPLAIDPASDGAIAGPGMSPNGGNHNYEALARLAPGVTAEQANAELRALTRDWTAQGAYAEDWEFQASAVPVRDEVTGQLRPALLVLLGAVGLVLLIACVNVASLLLVRGEGRRREVGVRAALGAGRRRLLWQSLSESLVIAALGGAVGLYLASAGVALARRAAPVTLPRVAEASLDGGVLLFTLGISVVTALLFGLLPALRAAGLDPAETLRDGGRGGTGGAERLRVRQALVVAEIALAVVLAIGAGLMVRTVGGLLGIDPGFRAGNVLTLRLSVPSALYPEPEDVARYYAQVLERVRALPGVESAAAARLLPLSSAIGDWGLMVEGYVPAPGRYANGDWQVVTPGYLETMGIRLVEGRVLRASDDAAAPPVLVVNETLARAYFPPGRALGGRVRLAGPSSPWATVVGVVEDVRHNGLTEAPKEQFYAPHAQWPVSTGFAPRSMSVVVRGRSEPRALVGPVVAGVRAVDPRIPPAEIRPMEEIEAGSIAQPRFTMLLLVLFGALALVLALVGIYGVVSYSVAARARETGIRLALGASPREVVWRALRQGVAQALAGVALGGAAAALATRAMAGLLYEVRPADPATFAVVLLGATSVAVLASLLPARRAAAVDPIVALRAE